MADNGWRRRLHPKLRVIYNGDEQVNAVRAEVAACLKVTGKSGVKLARAVTPLGAARTPATVPAAADTALKDLQPGRRAISVNVFVETRGPADLKGERARQGNLAIAQVPVDDLEKLAGDERVAFVEPAENLKFPKPDRLVAGDAAPAPRGQSVGSADRHRGGAGVLIGIVDVEGFDFAHPDFLDASGKTRFVRIWDQGGSANPARRPPSDKGPRFNYGAEFRGDVLNKAIADAKASRVSPHDLEPQSQMLPASHGTHVASIAAGNRGVCAAADIAAVLVSLPSDEPPDRRTSFYDSTRLVDAIEYLLDLAEELKRPMSINVSLGTNGHAHDGSSAIDRWIDAWLARPGRSICVAAGNAGQEREETPGDLGYVMGRIHTGGRIAAKGLDHDVDWVVAGNGVMDVSENELEIWYEAQDRFAVSVRPPGGAWTGPIAPGEYLENFQLQNQTILSVYNELYHPANGHNYISVYLSPNMNGSLVGIAAGTWQVRLTGLDVRDGRFHGWIERDDPARAGDGAYFYPSFFSERSNVDASSVSSLACGERIISVANLDEPGQRIHISSSQGPTRTGQLKPDVAAPGTAVVAANGFGRPNDPWVAMTGTSMASPYVAGVVGLMLAAEPRLGAAQINGILKATARPLPGNTYEWVNDCGFGVVDASACIREAAAAFVRADAKGRFE